ncbi:MAG: 4Fe-4S binding protein [Spirochaetes bacterium]|nr:4Fe-4S binding protein [Spirochaetota bacterium]
MKMTTNYDAHPVFVELAEMFSAVKVMGPPMSEKLIALVSHLFSLDEAHLCRHLSFIYPKTLKQIARKSGVHPDALAPMLEEMCRKRTIITIANRFMLYPLIPGMFEHVLRIDNASEWHVVYADLMNGLVETGYMDDYFRKPVNAIRSLPVERAVEAHSVIIDTDLVSEMIGSHKHFGVYHICPCRNSMHLTGHDCSRASRHDGCLTFGDYSLGLAREGNGRTVSREELRDIVEERWAKNLVFFTSNAVPSVQTAICTCCDCCCRALKIHNSLHKNFVAPPHVIAEVDESLCTNCGRCGAVCNTHAHILENGEHGYVQELCIGCGNCVSACNNKAITMTENRSYRPPSRSHARLIMTMLPAVLLTGTRIKMKRYFSGSR